MSQTDVNDTLFPIPILRVLEKRTIIREKFHQMANYIPNQYFEI